MDKKMPKQEVTIKKADEPAKVKDFFEQLFDKQHEKQ
jgi:hypothetical protein